MGELISAWSDWWSGGSVSDYPLWGLTVLFWGRLGKGLQFLAGLVVVLDLLSPDKLRARGTAARRELATRTARWRRHKAANRVERLREALEGSLSFQRGRPADKHQWVAEPPNPIPGVAETDLRDWTRETRAAMNPDDWRLVKTMSDFEMILNGHERKLVDNRIREFLHAHVTRYEYAAWRAFGPHVTRRRTHSWAFWMAVGLGIAVLPVITSALGLGPDLDGPVPLPVILPSAAALLIGGFALIGVGDLFAARLLRLPRIAFYTATASVLDSARPGHKLRWLGLFLFIIGFQFDLLAS